MLSGEFNMWRYYWSLFFFRLAPSRVLTREKFVFISNSKSLRYRVVAECELLSVRNDEMRCEENVKN